MSFTRSFQSECTTGYCPSRSILFPAANRKPLHVVYRSCPMWSVFLQPPNFTLRSNVSLMMETACPSEMFAPTPLTHWRHNPRDNDNVVLSHLSTASRPGLETTQTPTQWVTGSFHSGSKRPGREPNTLSSPEVKNLWKYSSIPQRVYSVWCLIKYSDNLPTNITLHEASNKLRTVRCLTQRTIK
jgi:hypothetical protein